MSACLLLLVVCVGAPIALAQRNRPYETTADCETGAYVADKYNLCIYYHCDGTLPILRPCPPGARVNTNFKIGTAIDWTPCVVLMAKNETCLRKTDDGPGIRYVNHCLSNPCPAECTCNSNADSYKCRCEPIIETNVIVKPSGDTGPEKDFCIPNQCENGGTCHSQYDGHYCQCPPGFTGKNCEVNMCNPNPCQNGGTCEVGLFNIFCVCRDCYEGSCCQTQSAGGNCGRNDCPPCGRGTQACPSSCGTGPQVRCDNGACYCADTQCYQYSFQQKECRLKTGLCECANRCGDVTCVSDDGNIFGQTSCLRCNDCEEEINGQCVWMTGLCRCSNQCGSSPCIDNPNRFGDEPECIRCNDCEEEVNGRCIRKVGLCRCSNRCGRRPCIDNPEYLLQSICIECNDCEEERNGQCIPLNGLCRCNNKCKEQVGVLCVDSADRVTGTPRCETSQTAGIKFTTIFLVNVNDKDTLNRPLELYVAPAGKYNARVRVDAPADNCYDGEIMDIPAETVARFQIPQSCMATGRRTSKAITVTELGDQNVVAYGINKKLYSADGFLALPNQMAGTLFRTVSWHPISENGIGTQFGFVALEDNTRVEVLCPTSQNSANNDFFVVILMKHDTFRVESVEDLSASVVKSDKPIHCYSGNKRASIPDSEKSRDHIVEQIPPMRTWGRKFVVLPVMDRIQGAHDKIRLIQAYNTGESIACTVYTNTDAPYNVEFNGAVGSYKLSSNYPVYVECNQPVMCVQFTCSKAQGETIHDPSAIIVPPVVQFATRFIYNPPEFTGGVGGSMRPYTYTAFLIVVKSGDHTGVLVNGEYIFDNQQWLSVPGPFSGQSYLAYSFVVNNAEGQYIITHVLDYVSFQCLVYGSDDRESYGMAISMGLNTITSEEPTPAQLGFPNNVLPTEIY